MEAQSIQPHFDVFTRDQNICPSELLVMRAVTVSTQTSLDKGALLFRQPRDSVWVVGDEPVRPHRNYDGK